MPMVAQLLCTQFTTEPWNHRKLKKTLGIVSMLLRVEMIWVPYHLSVTQNMKLKCLHGMSWEKVTGQSPGKWKLLQVFISFFYFSFFSWKILKMFVTGCRNWLNVSLQRRRPVRERNIPLPNIPMLWESKIATHTFREELLYIVRLPKIRLAY